MYTILSVDDDKLIRELIRNTLQEKYSVLDMESPEEAISYLKNNQVDLLLLDFEMPEMTGLECYREIKKLSIAKDMPVLFVTSVSDGNRVIECIREGSSGYILKPIDTCLLLSEIEKALKYKAPVNFFEKRVYAIDDSKLGLATIKNAIEDVCDLTLETSPHDALRFLSLNKVDLILLDYEMPHMNGLETLQALRASGMNKDTPIYFITALTDAKKIKECIRAGADDYIIKPIDKELLQKRVLERLNQFL